MIILLKKKYLQENKNKLVTFLKNKISSEKILDITERMIEINNSHNTITKEEIRNFSCVRKIMVVSPKFRLISEDYPKYQIKGKCINQKSFNLIAGPCSIEDFDSMNEIASKLKQLGINFIRGGSFKLRTSPYDFQGSGEKGIKILKEISDKYDLISVSEVTCIDDIHLMEENIDILMVGTRNMHNYRLLKELGKLNNPVILKRGMSATIEEWLLAAEHIKKNGNGKIILCERGIRTFENYTRNTLDLTAVPIVKSKTKLPIIVDPSHSTGNRNLVESMSSAAIAAGANGLIIEVHFAPDRALTDSYQTINLSVLERIIKKKNKLLKIL